MFNKPAGGFLSGYKATRLHEAKPSVFIYRLLNDFSKTFLEKRVSMELITMTLL